MNETPEERARRLGLTTAPSETVEERAKRLGLDTERPGVLARAGRALRSTAQQMIEHPIDTGISMVTAPVRSAVDAVLAPGVGERRHDPRLSKGGNSRGLTAEQIQRDLDTPYDAEHGAVTSGRRMRAGAETIATIAFPGMMRLGARGAAAVGAGARLADVIGTSAAGAATGAAYNPDDPAVGALIGSTLAAALPEAGRAAKNVAEFTRVPQAVGNVLPRAKKPGVLSMVTGTTTDAARADVLRQLERGKVSLPALRDRVSTAHPDEMLLDVGGPQLVERAGGAVATPSTGSADIVRALDARGQRAPKALRGQASESMGMPRQNVVQTLEDQAAERSRVSDKNFDALRSYYHRDPQKIEILDAMLDRPSVKKALDETETILKESGKLSSPLRESVRDAKGKIREIVRPLTFEEATLLKQAHDDVAGMGTQISTIESGGVTKTRARHQKGTHAELLDAIKQSFPGDETAGVPSYEKALGDHASQQQLIDAHLEGQKFMRAKTDELEAMWPKLSEPEREFYRKGAIASIDDAVRGKTDGVNPTRDFRDDIMRDNLRIILPSSEAADAFNQYVERAHSMHDNRIQISRNSKTASRLLQNADGAPEVAGVLRDVRSPAGLLTTALRSTAARRAMGLSEQHVNALAPLLTARGPELERVVQELMAAAGGQSRRSALRQRVGAAAATQAARKQP